MEEVFQNYKHFLDWITENFGKDAELDSIIINEGLAREIDDKEFHSLHEVLSKDEFNKKESDGFIKIPKLIK